MSDQPDLPLFTFAGEDVAAESAAALAAATAAKEAAKEAVLLNAKESVLKAQQDAKQNRLDEAKASAKQKAKKTKEAKKLAAEELLAKKVEELATQKAEQLAVKKAEELIAQRDEQNSTKQAEAQKSKELAAKEQAALVSKNAANVKSFGAAAVPVISTVEEDIEESSSEPHVMSIEELNVTIKKMLEGQLHTIWVRGEISNFKAHSSGHFYFSLKDAKSQISAVMFRGYNSKLRFRPGDGVEVIVRGRISVFEPRGSYQILCEMMEPVGAGQLQKAFEQLKEKLKSEGLFELARKKPIPAHPRLVAIVTSPTGAAIRDIINVLTRRAPWLPITIVPTIVQGDGCAPKICEAFEKAQRIPDVDVIIIGRGGGSIEDLWGFNDETLARLIAASKIPVISAVGHEIDFTISDFVADLRAPTPSAAAELVAKSSNELKNRLDQLEKLLRFNTAKHLQVLDQKLKMLCKSLVDPQKKLQDLSLRNDDLLTRLQMAKDRALSDRHYKLKILQERMGTPMAVIQERIKGLEYHRQCINKALNHFLEMKRSTLFRWTSMLDTLSPLKVVERGYSVVKKDEVVVTKTEQVTIGDQLNIMLAQGQLVARVEVIKEKKSEV